MSRRPRAPTGGRAVLCAALVAGCAPEAEPDRARGLGRRVAEASVRAEEWALRASLDFASLGDETGSLGADPSDIAALGSGSYAGLLRGAGEVVVLDAALRAVARAAAPPHPTALAASEDGAVWVSSGVTPRISAYRWGSSALARAAELDFEVPTVASIRDVAVGPGPCVYAVAELDDALVCRCGDATSVRSVPAGPSRVVVAGGYVFVASNVDHALSGFMLDERGLPGRPIEGVRRDGPFFGVAAAASPGAEGAEGTVWIALGAVEDRPLDRTGGFFGYVDSFVSVLSLSGGRVSRVLELNVGERGVVTPKALAIEARGADTARLFVTGYASEVALDLEVRAAVQGEGAVTETSVPAVPGIAALVPSRTVRGAWVGASPLVDGWVELSATGARSVAADEARVLVDPRAAEARLGEALFYTSLMAPWQTTEGAHSRFTCETCHLEGGVDGRTHRTGRGDVVATTKPLRGIFNNAPHFTRALDEDTTEMVFAEFRVAAAGTGHDGWFSLGEAPLAWPAGAPWIERVDGSPIGLRRALLTYLAVAAHPPNARAFGRTAFDDRERAGAAVFEERCASCHAPRVVASDPATAVPAAGWEALVLSEAGPIVWARDGYEKTGVEPYVHAEGARPTSLRRAVAKRPYFTNGSARSLEEVVRGVRFGSDGAFFHDGAAPGAAALSDEDATDLLAFLRLL